MDINIGELGDTIAKMLEEYSDEAETKVKETMQDVAKSVVNNLKNNVNIPQRSKDQKTYKKQFYLKKDGTGLAWSKITIANKKYRLTHLLERGHAKSNGGRTKAYPHWADAQKEVDKLPDMIKEALSK